MKADATVIENLQTTCQVLAALAAQYQVDVQQLKTMDLDWLACRVKKWYGAAECHLRIAMKRLLYYGEDPTYSVGEVTGADSVEALLKRAETNVYAAFEQFCTFRKTAWDIRADGVVDIYEHMVQEMECQAFKIERELDLLGLLREPGYIAARLEDGGK